MTATPAFAALLFLPFVVPLCFWVIWSDLSSMKIPNKAVMTLVAIFAVVGLIALPFEDYLWRWLNLAVILLIGFVVSSLRLVGAGDSKFAAAMAPFVAAVDTVPFLMLFSIILLAAFATHRVCRAVPALRGAVPGWKSWGERDFPMGFALGGSLVGYLGIAAALGP